MKGIESRDAQRAIDTIVLAFAADPVERWMYPSAGDYLHHFRAFVEAFAGPALADGTAWMLDDFAAVALWLGPGSQPEGETIVSVLIDSVMADRQDDLLAVLTQMDAMHPTSAHWYLPWLAVDPARQRDGLGGRLLDLGLRRVDRDGLPAYLETPNPQTIAFYERRGFQVTGQARSGECPPITAMLRPAAAPGTGM
jgi:ribosomal protein S18 acetylase RimI-like enzyme